MKKLLNLLLCLTVILALAGCGKEQTVSYTMVSDVEGMTMTDTQTLKAKGDIVYELTEITTLDLSTVDAETQQLLITYYDETIGAMKESAPEGVTVTYSYNEGIYTIEFIMDLKTADLQDLIDGGFMMALDENSEDADFISLKQTVEALESAGYELQQ